MSRSLSQSLLIQELSFGQEVISGDLCSLQKLNDEALAHASLKYNLEVAQLKSENTKLSSEVEKEWTLREKLESEVSVVGTGA